MAKIAMLYCKRIQDHSCIACAKCYKGIALKSGKFDQYDEIDLVAMTDCGDCPGLVFPRVKLIDEITKNLDLSIDMLHFGTCIMKAVETAACPINLEQIKKFIEGKFGINVVFGTHEY
jgi:predicted metal-binding protein